MTDENTPADGPSQEAFDRIKAERDALKAKVAEAEGKVQDATTALKDVEIIDRSYEHFKAQGVGSDPYGLAREAILNPKVKQADPDTLGEVLDGWYERARSIFGATEQPAAPTEQAPPAEPPKAPMTQPNPAAPGSPVGGGAPLLVGSPEFDAQYGHLSLSEQRAVVQRGEAVFSPEVAAAQKNL